MGRYTMVGGALLLVLSLAVPALADHIPIAGEMPDHCRRVEPTKKVPHSVQIGKVTFSVDQWFVDQLNPKAFNAFATGPISGLEEGQVVDYAIKGSSTDPQEGTLALEAFHGFLEPLEPIEHVTFCLVEGERPTSESESETESPTGDSSNKNSQESSTPITSEESSTQSDASEESDTDDETEVLGETLARTGPGSDRLPIVGMSSIMGGLGLVLLSKWPQRGRHSAVKASSA